jgi:eukaryotic-like serine/threonine-protein kinase
MTALDSNFRNSALASGLISHHQLDYVLRLARHRLQSGVVSPVEEIPDKVLAEILVEQALLTNYQADQLMAGRRKLTLGPYVVTDFIGQGGMGQVFKAVHQVMGRQCAIKVLPLHRATPETLASFNREIRVQAKLDCPYLVRAFDAGQDGNVHYLVTEYVPGMDLRRLVKSHGKPLPVHQAAAIVMQAAIGLDYAHQQGMIHRDVKPGNILVTPEGLAKVSDVGLAGFSMDLSDDPRAGKIVGTADYLSPEQIRTPLEITTVSDVYSLGCTLYYAVCGKVPFPGGDTASKIRRHLSETPIHPRRFQPELTDEFVDIIAEMMDKNPKERTQTCAEVSARLEPWAGDVGDLTMTRMTRGPWTAPPPTHDPFVEVLDDGLADSTGYSSEVHQATRSEAIGFPDRTERATASAPNRASPVVNSLDELPSNSYIPPIQSRAIPSVPTVSDAPHDSNLNNFLQNIKSEVALHPKAASSRRTLTVLVTIALILPPALVIGGIIGFLLRPLFER